MTVSALSTTFPADNTKVNKSTMRDQYSTIKDDLDALYKATNYARRNIAFEWRNL